MPRAMNTAISGLKAMQTWLDIVANNVVNSNSTAYKASRAVFQDILSQTQRTASGPQGTLGGVNAQQVGLGMQVGGISTQISQGAIQSTGKLTDFAVQGEGFFIVNDGTRDFYTRDGTFDLALDGTLISSLNGFPVRAWQADATTAAIDTTAPPTTVKIPIGTQGLAKESQSIVMVGNLDSNTAAFAAGPPVVGTVNTTITVFDSQGDSHLIQLTFTNAAAVDTWTLTATESDAAITSVTVASGGTVTFGATGTMTSANPTLDIDFDAAVTGVNDLTTAVTKAVSLSMTSGLTQVAASSSVSSQSQDGTSSGTLLTFSVSTTGLITGIFSNGNQINQGQISLATFPNPAGLNRVGTNIFEVSANSGDPNVGAAQTGSRGTIANGAIEGSNVDLAQEFTNLILAQRGFQANSRMITTNDEILQELVNLKR